MPLPPVEEQPNSMTRRHFLVERNRLRVKAYEPTRKAFEEHDVQLAQKRQEERSKMLDTWKSHSSYNPDFTRSLPGGGPRSKRMKEAAALKNPNYYKIIKEEEMELKAERTAAYKADMMQQLKERRDFLTKWRAEEKAYVNSLVENHRERARQLEEREREEARATKLYMDRMRESNLMELEQKRAKQKAREEYELSIIRSIQEADMRKALQEERRAKDMKTMLQKQNEDYHRTLAKRQEEGREREKEDLRNMLEYNASLAAAEQREQQRKKDQFKADFEETIEKQKEFRRTHNYDEPMESIRRRNEKAAESLALIKQEERLRLSERRRQYRDDLMKQIREKQEWQMTHLDGV